MCQCLISVMKEDPQFLNRKIKSLPFKEVWRFYSMSKGHVLGRQSESTLSLRSFTKRMCCEWVMLVPR